MSYTLAVSIEDRQNIKALRETYTKLMKESLINPTPELLREKESVFQDLIQNLALYQNEITYLQGKTSRVYYYYGRRFIEIDKLSFDKFNYVGLISFRDTVLIEKIKQEIKSNNELITDADMLYFFNNKVQRVFSEIASTMTWFIRDFRKTSGGSLFRLLMAMQKFFEIDPTLSVSKFKKTISHYEPKLKKDRTIIYHHLKKVYKTVFGDDLSVINEMPKQEIKFKLYYALQNEPELLNKMFKFSFLFGMFFDYLDFLQCGFYANISPFIMFVYLRKKGYPYDFNKTLFENFIDCLAQEIGVYPHAINIVRLSKLSKSDFPYKNSKKHLFYTITYPYTYGFIKSQFVTKYDKNDNPEEFEMVVDKNILLWTRPTGYFINHSKDIRIIRYPMMVGGHEQNVVNKGLKEKFAKLRAGQDVDFSDDEEYLKLLREKTMETFFQKKKIYTTRPVQYLVKQEINMRKSGRFVYSVSSNLRQLNFDLFYYRLSVLSERKKMKGLVYRKLKQIIKYKKNSDGSFKIDVKFKKHYNDIITLQGVLEEYFMRLPERIEKMLPKRNIGGTAYFFIEEFKRYFGITIPKLIYTIVEMVYDVADDMFLVLPHLSKEVENGEPELSTISL